MESLCCSKWTQLITTTLLVLSCLLKIALSCSCFPKHPQSHFCQADYAVRATIINSHVVWPSANHIVKDGAASLSSDVIHSAERAYKVQVKQVFKGDGILRNQIMFLYTPYEELLCGIGGLEEDGQYLFMGSYEKVTGKHSFNLCGFHHKWSDVTEKQVEGLRHGYKNNCDAKIVVCGIDATCSSNNNNNKATSSESIATKHNTNSLNGLNNNSLTQKLIMLKTSSVHHRTISNQDADLVCEWDPWKGVCEKQEAVCKRHGRTGQVHWDLSPEYETCLALVYPGAILSR